MRRRLMRGVAIGIGVALFGATPAWAMQIYVRPPSGEIQTLEVESSDTIDNVKAMFQDRTDIAPGLQDMSFNGTVLQDGRSLSDYNIQRRDTIDVALPTPAWADDVLVEAVSGSVYDDGVSIQYRGLYSVFSGSLPPGLTLDAQTGRIGGLSSTDGTYPVTIRATSLAGAVDLPLTVRVAPSPAPPVSPPTVAEPDVAVPEAAEPVLAESGSSAGTAGPVGAALLMTGALLLLRSRRAVTTRTG